MSAHSGEGRAVHEPRKGVNISDAVNTGSRASKPVTVHEAYLKNTVQALAFIQENYTHGKMVVEFQLPGGNS